MAGVPVLYSFRRCPYAIRARLGLRAAGWRHLRLIRLRLLLHDQPLHALPRYATCRAYPGKC